MIETVYNGQDHHEDRMYPTIGAAESCSCAELLLDEVRPPSRYRPR